MSDFVTICILRHAEVAEAWQGRIYGALDVPLSERGEAQSRRAARALDGVPFRAVVSSGLIRTEHTAALLRAGSAVADRERRDEARLKEIDRGRWAGWERERVEAEQPGAWDRFWESEGLWIPPGGETLEHVQERVSAALDDLAASFSGSILAVVAHKWVLRAASCAALGWPMDASPRIRAPHTAMAVVRWPVDRQATRPSLLVSASMPVRGWETRG